MSAVEDPSIGGGRIFPCVELESHELRSSVLEKSWEGAWTSDENPRKLDHFIEFY